MIMYDFFFWSGIAAWLLVGLAGLSLLIDVLIDQIILHFWTKREFLAFVADRLKRKP